MNCKTMEEIIAPVERELIKAELTPDKFLRPTNKGGNLIYVTTANESPNVMREIARLRELAFRLAGGGSGKSMDMDQFDWMDRPYKQLFVWDPQNEEIIGGYRYILGKDVDILENGQPNLITSEMYWSSPRFIQEYLPYTLELGRSFVHPDYQASKMGAKSLFALDNLWDGLGALTVLLPDAKYMYGKVTVYPHYNANARDLIFGFISKYFPDNEKLITPIDPFEIAYTPEQIDAIFTAETYKENYKILNKEVRALGVNIPPLVNAYMGLSPTMKLFGTAINEGFGDVEETGILIAVDEILPEKRIRHIDSFAAEHPELFRAAQDAGKLFYSV